MAGGENLDRAEPDHQAALSLQLLLTALALAVGAEVLAWTDGPAVSGFALWVVLLAGCVCIRAKLVKTANLPFVLLWSAVACLAATVLVLRSLELLIPLMWLLMLTAAVLLAVKAVLPSMLHLRIVELLQGLILTLVRTAFGMALMLAGLRIRSASISARQIAWLRGLLFTLPLLVIFLALFASADAVFARFTAELGNWFSREFSDQILRTALFAWLSAGLLSVLCHYQLKFRPVAALRKNLGSIESSIILGTLALLFTLFVLLQLSYLFGGRATIEATTGLTLASYSRRGFFELLAVAGLTLTLLTFMANVCSDPKRFRQLALVLVVCVLLIQVSAAQRLLLYIDEFGLTLERMLASAVMLWLAAVFLIFTATVLRGTYQGFVYFSVSSGVAIALAFALINPAALIVRINIDKSIEQQRVLDMNNLLSLGIDAVPVLLTNLDRLGAREQCMTALSVLNRWPLSVSPESAEETNTSTGGSSTKDWRNFNLGRWRAQQAITQHREELEALAAKMQENFNADIYSLSVLDSGLYCEPGSP